MKSFIWHASKQDSQRKKVCNKPVGTILHQDRKILSLDSGKLISQNHILHVQPVPRWQWWNWSLQLCCQVECTISKQNTTEFLLCTEVSMLLLQQPNSCSVSLWLNVPNLRIQWDAISNSDAINPCVWWTGVQSGSSYLENSQDVNTTSFSTQSVPQLGFLGFH